MSESGGAFESACTTLLDPGAAWMQGVQVVAGRPLTNRDGVGIGAVLVVLKRTPLEILVVQKAEVDGYEFGGMWSMPGGMVRCDEDLGLDASPLMLLERSLARRARLECGVTGVRAGYLSPVRVLPPPVTRYTAKGRIRHTSVLPFLFSGSPPTDLVANDPSVRNSRWMGVVDALQVTTPANRLVLAKVVWPLLAARERDVAAEAVDAARRTCDAWADEVGLPRSGSDL